MDDVTREMHALALKHHAEHARLVFRAIYDHAESLLALQERAWRNDVALDLRPVLDLVHDAEASYASVLEQLSMTWLAWDVANEEAKA